MKIYGNHIGLVVNTEDPERRGRVQVLIPHISTTLYDGWNKKNKNIKFKTLDDGENGSSVFTKEILERLYVSLPWAEAVVPFWGGSTGMPINESYNQATPIPTDQNFDYGSLPDGDVVATIGPKDNQSSGPHLHAEWEDKRPITSNDIDKYIRANGSLPSSFGVSSKYGPRTPVRTVNGQSSSYHRGVDFRTPEGTSLSLANGATVIGGYKSSKAGSYVLTITTPEGNMVLRHLGDIQSSTQSSGSNKTAQNQTPPTEAYADTRKAQVDMLARSDGNPTGDTIAVGEGLSQAVSTSLQRGLGLNSSQLANNAAIAYGTAYQEAISRGLTPQQASIVAAGILGNIKQETNYNPNLTHDNNTGYGLLGWASRSNDQRLNNLIQFAQKSGELSGLNYTGRVNPQSIVNAGGISIPTQIRFFFAELDGAEGFYNRSDSNNSRFWDTIKGSRSPSEAAANISNLLVRPGTPRLENRIAAANNANQAFSSIGAGELVAAVEGQNVLRTRTPDFYGSLDGPRTGSTMGFNSIPYVGSKVWVFFVNGDVQKPAYFGSIYEPNNIV